MASVLACHAGGALGRLAFFRARLALDRQSQSQHVHAHRYWCGRRLCVQRSRHAFPKYFSAVVLWPQRNCRGLLRGGGDHHHPSAVRPSARAARAQSDQQRYQSTPWIVTQDSTIDSRRRPGRRRSPGWGSSWRSFARSARRKGSRRRRSHRRHDVDR